MNTKRLALTTLAVAAAGAAGTANAQSSITLYGVVDAFYQYATADESVNRLQSGGINGSRLGVRGVEDLGGGLKALFTLESGINIDTGTTAQDGVFWGRQAFVGLGSDFGTLTLGRQYSSVYYLTSDLSEFSNNAAGPSTAVIGGFGGLGLYEPVRGAAAQTGTTAVSSSTGLGGPARVNNSVKYETPSFSGFKLGGLYGFGESTATTGGQRTYDLYARYTAGPFDAMLSYVDDRTANEALHAQTYSAGAAWSFGTFRILGGYLGMNDKSITNNDGDGWWIGGDARFGPHLVKLQYVANTPDADNSDTQALGLGYQYDFSKRTAFYSSITYFKNDGNVARWHSAVPAGLAAVGGDNDITEFVAGIRHSF
jgi:predicted porin